ncbi:MAG: pyrimidine/purine nucleoside phosphorylase [Rhodopirellula sp. JB053]|uniref:pyrimidine/purine nucleoside phosphorylase n=1 Tax=Rhodopirellula sp. JB044 TaxID=3342844 RepID=UPI00370ACDB2
MNVNEYFDGKVKSIGFTNSEGRVTSGVMQEGDYEFGTTEKELMKVVSGTMQVKLPGEGNFRAVAAGQEFRVDANEKFQVRVDEPTAYLCFYS